MPCVTVTEQHESQAAEVPSLTGRPCFSCFNAVEAGFSHPFPCLFFTDISSRFTEEVPHR